MSIKMTCKTMAKEYNEPLKSLDLDVCCALCEKIIVKTYQLKEIPDEKRYKFKCPTCGGSSFITTFKYKMFIEPINCVINNITEEDGVWLVDLN